MIQEQAQNVFDEVTDFLVSQPSDEALLAYRFSEELQARLHYLLDLNGEGELSCCEERELDEFIRANRILTTLKINTELRIRGIKA